MTNEQIMGTLKKNKGEIYKMGVKRIGLFGSHIRNQQTKKSDIDILVEFEAGKKSYRNFLKVAEFTQSLFGPKVDLVTTDSLSKYIGPYIKKEVVYA